MTKAEFVGKVAEGAGLSKKDAEAAIDATFEAVAEALAAKDKVTVSGFGTFSTKERAERTGINPATKEKMTVAASTAAVFKVSKTLKDRVNK